MYTSARLLLLLLLPLMLLLRCCGCRAAATDAGTDAVAAAAGQRQAYRERIMAAVPAEFKETFEPHMALYLTDTTSPEEIAKAKASGMIRSCKMYPVRAQPLRRQ